MPEQTLTLPAPARPKGDPREETRQPRAWNVVLVDDQDHSYEYVIRMMQEVFGHTLEKAFKIAKTVDGEGRAVCLTTHKEHAELKCEQIQSFGKDALIAGCAGAMTSIIEPADSGGDDEDNDRN